VVDLRTQLRSSEIDAVSKDGNPFKAILFSAFAIDRQEWSVAELHRLQNANPILKDGKELDHNLGSFPYSQARVRAATQHDWCQHRHARFWNICYLLG